VREAKRLSIRLLGEGAHRTLLFEERRERLDPAQLGPLGLTPREAEVLAWLGEGKTNEAIGLILGTRAATVAKHLERIYAKLGVETRTAAVLRALSVAGTSPSTRAFS
jgi:DNA-binding CsgD family transcriptional regulator